MSESDLPDDAAEPQPTAPDLRLTLDCPGCGQSGTIRVARLHRGLRCPRCRKQFLIDRSGQVLALSRMAQTRFTCPRCGQSGSVPKELKVRRAECAQCKLPLAAGPDQRLHGAREAAEMIRQSVARSKRYALVGWMERRLGVTESRARKLVAVLCVALLAALIGGGLFGARQLFDDSPQRSVRGLVRACLHGNAKAAQDYLDDDAVQRLEFERWRIRHFASIVDQVRPSGDRVEIQIEPLSNQADEGVFLVTLSSAFFGARSHEQVWRQLDGRWQFDALATLDRHDRPPVAQRQTTPAATVRIP